MNLNTFLQIMNLPLNLSVDEILEMLIIYLRKSRKDMDYFKDEVGMLVPQNIFAGNPTPDGAKKI